MPGLLLKHLESGGKQIKQTDKTVGYETEDIFSERRIFIHNKINTTVLLQSWNIKTGIVPLNFPEEYLLAWFW